MKRLTSKLKLTIASAFVVHILFQGVSAFAESGTPSPAAKLKTPAKSKGEAKQWKAKMRQIQEVSAELLLYTSSDAKFAAEANRATIQRLADRLAELTHDIDVSKLDLQDRDPTLPLVASLFAQDTRRAASALKSGHRPYARGLLRSMTSYCLACHTRTAPQDLLDLANRSLKGTAKVSTSEKELTPLERAQFYAASWSLDPAFKQYLNIISDKNAPNAQSIGWERAIRDALVISARLENSPDRAKQVIDAILKNPSSPPTFREQAKGWEDSLAKWKKSERELEGMTAGQLVEKGFELYQNAKLKSPTDRSQDINLLRSSSYLHHLLAKFPKTPRAAEALLTLGEIYDTLQGLDVWSLPERLYLACIYSSPGSPTSETCFKKYKEMVVAGYTGSAGTDLPDEISKHLKQVEEIAKPKDAVAPQLK